jgi:hypothetical protein
VKTKRVILIVVLLVAAYVVATLPHAISSERHKQELERTFAALRSLPRERVATAVEAFIGSRKTGNTALPATVTFAELVSGGYLATNEIAAFDGKEVIVSLGITDAPPQAILIRVRMPDGRDVVEWSDGSCVMLPPNKALEPTATTP